MNKLFNWVGTLTFDFVGRLREIVPQMAAVGAQRRMELSGGRRPQRRLRRRRTTRIAGLDTAHPQLLSCTA